MVLHIVINNLHVFAAIPIYESRRFDSYRGQVYFSTLSNNTNIILGKLINNTN